MLPKGKWKIDHDGYKRQLEIKGVDAEGKIDASMENVPVIGFWEEDAKRITFQRPIKIDPAHYEGYRIGDYIVETFVGYLFDDDPDRTGTVTHYTMAGTFDYFGPAKHGATKRSQRMVMGWYAQIEKTSQKGDR